MVKPTKIKVPGVQNKMIVVEWDKLDALLKVGATSDEVEGVLGYNHFLMDRRVKEKYGISYTNYIKLKHQDMRASLRRMQYMKARDGNPAMLIWLGKNILGQSDRAELIHRGLDINIHVTSERKRKRVAEYIKDIEEAEVREVGELGEGIDEENEHM